MVCDCEICCPFHQVYLQANLTYLAAKYTEIRIRYASPLTSTSSQALENAQMWQQSARGRRSRMRPAGEPRTFAGSVAGQGK